MRAQHPSRSHAAKRDRPKLIRYSPDELAIVTERARAAGRPIARFIREASLGNSPRARRTATSDVIIRQLARVATHLTELSRIASESRLPGAEAFQDAIGDVVEAIRLVD